VNDIAPKDRDIAMVFQSYALYPHMSVYDNMAFGLKLRKTPKTEMDQRVKEAADILGIGHLLDRKPRQLSGGQRQRVALGRAIVREPQVFLMDEPLSNLDAKLRVQTRTEISKLHLRLQATFIYVTHDQTEAMTMGSRIAVMKDGILQQGDTPSNLYNNPDNMFVAGFIGSPAMNFFDVNVVGTADEMYLEGAGFKIRVPPAKARPLVSHLGKGVVFGIRPEDIHDREFAPPGITTEYVQTQVDVTELMGSEVYLYLLADSKTFIARVDPRTTARIGQKMDVAFNMDNVHFFDKETEKTIR
jgi:multiple sugar transport system ATP-binding protein